MLLPRAESFHQDELDQTGPLFWPVPIAHVADRYMVARPEVFYLRARTKMLQRIEAGKDHACQVKVVITVIYKPERGKAMKSTVGSFFHTVSGEDLQEDIRLFCHELRSYLFRQLPDTALYNRIVRIDFLASGAWLEKMEWPWR